MDVSFFEAFLSGLLSALSPTGIGIGFGITVFLAAATCSQILYGHNNRSYSSTVLNYALVLLFSYGILFVLFGVEPAVIAQIPGFRQAAIWLQKVKPVIILAAALLFFSGSFVALFTNRRGSLVGNNLFLMVLAFLAGIFVALTSAVIVGPVLAKILFKAMEGTAGILLLSIYTVGKISVYLLLSLIVGWLVKRVSHKRKMVAFLGVFLSFLLGIMALFLWIFNQPHVI